jgi:alpha-L-arabinofuranosidase
VNANSISDLLNGWVGGVIQASRDRVYGTAEYYALKLYSEHLGTERLHTEIVSPSIGPTKAVDAISTRSTDGKKVYVKLSNADAIRESSITISFAHFRYAGKVNALILSASAPGERNSFNDPHRVSPEEKSIDCIQTCTLQLGADSVAVLTFQEEN